MRLPFRRFLLPLAACALLAACSTEKDAFLNRTFHRLVTRDNGWFNANEKLKETVGTMQKAYVDDYDQVLPLFVVGTEDQAKGMVTDLEDCIERCATVIDRNSMEFGGEEKNTWVDNAWFVIGQCHFYKRGYLDAERTFDYIGRRYKGQDKQMEAKIWLARTAIQLEQFAKAQSVLDEIKGQKTLPKDFPHDQLSAVQADIYLHRGKVDDAIPALEHAVDITRSKAFRNRWTYILAQLYQAKGMDSKAIATYFKVTRMGAPYEMDFHAQVQQALAFDRGNSKKLRQMLGRMLRDEKNTDHYDMIHYALADLDLKENKPQDAVDQLVLSCRTSTTDTRQKAKSFLKLADLYFDDKKYPAAQQYYDSTTTVLAEDHPRFTEVKTRAEVLGDLVEQLDIISREDSLQAMAKLDPEEREKRVRAMIRERELLEAEKEQAAADAREVLANNPAATTPGTDVSAGGAWYFYNPVQVARGMADFRKKWGNRPNDDDWRRADKSGTALVDVAEETEETVAENQEADNGDPAWKDPASYLKDIPETEAQMDSSNARICKALYLTGMIYKEKLRDVDNAIESFQVLNDRFEDCRFTPESNYQLYRIYLAKEKAGNFMDFGGASSQRYADLILQRWPGSEFARLVQDPGQLEADEAAKAAEAEAYATLYAQFRQGAYRNVIAACDAVLDGQPRNHLRPKYALLKAMAVGGLHMEAPFRDALARITLDYPGTDEAKSAQALLDNLGKNGPKTAAPGPDAGQVAYAEPMGEHFVVFMVPDSAGPITNVKGAIARFNNQYFPGTPMEISASIWDPHVQVVLIRLFETKQKAMAYYDRFRTDTGQLKGFNDKGWPLFAISRDNYNPFYLAKDESGYLAFFQRSYLSER